MRFNIIHTNDLHGHLESWPVIQEFIKQKIDSYQQAKEPYLILDDGDAMDTVHPLVEASQGQIMVDLFNAVGYDVVTLGNNEGLNFTQEELDKRYKSADFEIIISNLLNYKTKQIPDWAKSFVIKQVNGCKVAIFGLTAPYQTYYLNNYQIIQPFEAIDQTMDEIKQVLKPDLIILLSHLGLNVDREIAERYPQIGLIIGGHTHHVLHQGEWRQQTLLAGAGRYGEFIGEINIDFDPVSRNLEMMANTYDTSHLAREYGLDISRDLYLCKGQKHLDNQIVAHSKKNYLALDRQTEESFILMALEAISWATDHDLALLNTGLFLSDLPKGKVTQKDLHEALPHPMHLATISLTGEQLYELLCEIEDQAEDLQYQLIYGLGFRGKIFGEIVFKGIEFNFSDYQWYVAGETIDMQKIYHLVTVDHLWFLPFFPSIDRYGNPQLIFPDFLRHVVAKYLAKHCIGSDSERL